MPKIRPQKGTTNISVVIENKQILSTVQVLRRIDQAEEEVFLEFNAEDPQYTALWDTGAMRTTVLPRVVRNSNLMRSGFEPSVGIDGVAIVRPLYPAAFFFQTDRSGSSRASFMLDMVEVAMLERDDQLFGGIDVIIGMDIILKGNSTLKKLPNGNVLFTHQRRR